MKLVRLIYLSFFFLSISAWSEQKPQNSSYRATDGYLQNICFSPEDVTQETYLVSPYLLSRWQEGQKHQVKILEFLSGNFFSAKLTQLSKERGSVLINAGKKNFYLKCTGGVALPYRFQNGDILDEIAIDRSGQIIPGSDLDRGTEAAFGLVRYAADGNIVWSKFILARDNRCGRDPWHALEPIAPFNTYGGNFYVGRIFSDQSALILFSSSVIQLNLENGEMKVPSQNVFIVPLTDAWKLLRDLKNRS